MISKLVKTSKSPKSAHIALTTTIFNVSLKLSHATEFQVSNLKILKLVRVHENPWKDQAMRMSGIVLTAGCASVTSRRKCALRMRKRDAITRAVAMATRSTPPDPPPLAHLARLPFQWRNFEKVVCAFENASAFQQWEFCFCIQFFLKGGG